MAWELANEPRPMRPYANEDYKRWIADVAALLKSKDKNHLVVIGHEGFMGTENLELFEEIHADKNVDYLTIHIWAKNWGWFTGDKIRGRFPECSAEGDRLHRSARRHRSKAEQAAGDRGVRPAARPSFIRRTAPTTFRDTYYKKILSYIGNQAGGDEVVAGANFWAFGGTARPIKGQVFWKTGDDYMGDPPMEEQGLNTVFDSDASTWKVIKGTANRGEQEIKVHAG